MARAAKTRIVVEIEAEPRKWMAFKSGFSTVPQAEQWVRENLTEGVQLRVAKISGKFTMKKVIAKR